MRHGFPHWFGRTQTIASSSEGSSRNTSGSYNVGSQKLRDAVRPPPEDTHSRNSSVRSLPYHSLSQAQPISIIEVIQYVKHCFDDEGSLDTLPLDAAGNMGAWKAWRAYRKSTNSTTNPCAMEAGLTLQDEWSWDGVWEERVRKGIDASIADSTLYGNSAAAGEDLVCLCSLVIWRC